MRVVERVQQGRHRKRRKCVVCLLGGGWMVPLVTHDGLGSLGRLGLTGPTLEVD
jgi:hypothetical protein